MLKQRKVGLILGKTGSGKSTLARKLLRDWKRVIILDPLWEYEGFIVTSFSSFVSVFNRYYENAEEFKIVCRFEDEESIEFLFEAVWIIGDVLLVVEEADLYIGNGASFFDRLVNQGRHRDISLLAISRRVFDLPPSFRAQCSSIITFEQHEPNDLERLYRIGFEREEIENLQRYEFALWGDSSFIHSIKEDLQCQKN